MKENIRLLETLRLILYLFGVFILFYLYFSYTNLSYSECMTDNWCINSTESPLSFALLWTINIILLVSSIYFAKLLTLWLIMKGWMLHALITITMGFSSLGTLLYFTVIPHSERLEFLHILIISAVLGIIGIALVRKLRSSL